MSVGGEESIERLRRLVARLTPDQFITVNVADLRVLLSAPPAAVEREAREIVDGALLHATWYEVADQPDWKKRIADLVAPAIAAALRAPALSGSTRPRES